MHPEDYYTMINEIGWNYFLPPEQVDLYKKCNDTHIRNRGYCETRCRSIKTCRIVINDLEKRNIIK